MSEIRRPITTPFEMPDILADARRELLATSHQQQAAVQIPAVQLLRRQSAENSSAQTLHPTVERTAARPSYADMLRAGMPREMSVPVEPMRRAPLHEPSPILGFSSMEEFRNATRPLAQRHRNEDVIVRGSSVTGHSYLTGKPFNPGSDIDIALVSSSLRNSAQVDKRGFPVLGSELAREESSFQQSFRKATGRKTGVKVFEEIPGGQIYRRPHTPPPEREGGL